MSEPTLGEQIAREIQAACPKHMTRDYNAVDQAYDNAARIAREFDTAARDARIREGERNRVAVQLREQANQRFEQRGSYDARGAAFWDTHIWLVEEAGRALDAKEAKHE